MRKIQNIIGFLLVGGMFLINTSFAYAAVTWTQTNWAGGSGQATWSDATQYNTTGGDGLFVSSNAGQITMHIYASNAIGQQNTTSITANQGGSAAANTMSFMTSGARGGAMSVIATGKIFLADTSNHRVLIWNSIPTSNNVSADVVIGQTSFTAVSANRGGSVADNTLNYPTGVYSDGTKLYITDTGNNRVLIYDTIPTSDGASANWVVGQPNMTSSTANNGGIGAGTLKLKTGIATTYWGSVYANGTKLFISDSANHRILIFNTIPTSNGALADVVVGQPNMTSNTANNGGIGAGTLSKPTEVSSDGTKLFITDTVNNRVLVYNTIPTTDGALANVVIGQPDMTSSTFNNGGLAANRLNSPEAIYFDGTKLYISDYSNNRVLVYNSVPIANNASADEALCQPNFTSDVGNGGESLSYAGQCLQPRGFYQNSSARLILNVGRIQVFSLTTAHSSTLTSSVYDAGTSYTWGPLTYTATTPANTSVSFEVTTDGGSTWVPVTDYTTQTFGPSTTVAYRATLSNTDGVSTPILQDVTISGNLVPTVTTAAATSLTRIGATLNGEITATGGVNATVRGFNYGLTTGYGSTTTDSGSYGTGVFSSDISGLSCNTTYHFRAYATNLVGTSYSSDATFVTAACLPAGGGNSVSPTVPPLPTVLPPIIPATTYNFGLITLRYGSRGIAVKELQRFFNTTTALNLTVDGIFGSKTLLAVKQWQKNHHLIIDGMVGPKTRGGDVWGGEVNL